MQAFISPVAHTIPVQSDAIESHSYCRPIQRAMSFLTQLLQLASKTLVLTQRLVPTVVSSTAY